LIVHILWSLFGYQVGHNLMNLNHNHLRSRSNCTIIFAKQSVPLTKKKDINQNILSLHISSQTHCLATENYFSCIKSFSHVLSFRWVLLLYWFSQYDLSKVMIRCVISSYQITNEFLLLELNIVILIPRQLFCKVFA